MTTKETLTGGFLKTSVEDLFKSTNAWQSGHFLLTSGLHSDQYMQCQRVLQYPLHGMNLARELAKIMLDKGIKPKAVVGPALGAVHLEVFMALAFNELLGNSAGDQVRAVFAERADGTEFSIRRGVELAPGEAVIVVEDVTTTGGSARKVVELLKKMGANPLAVGTIIDRSGGTAKFDQPFFSLKALTLKTYEPKDCPMCQAGSEAIKPGSSKK
jgi:orotate phosphoribosyltransferase